MTERLSPSKRTLAEVAAELGLDESTIRRDEQRIVAKLRPLFDIANEAERAWLCVVIGAHLRGAKYFSSENPGFSRVPRRFSDKRVEKDIHASRAVTGSSVSPAKQGQRARLPSRWKGQR